MMSVHRSVPCALAAAHWSLLVSLLCALLQTTHVTSVNLATFRSLFVRMPQLQLSAIPTRALANATVELCARRCVQEMEFECKSFDFDNSFMECHLHNDTHEDSVAILQVSQYIDHYRSAFEKLFNRLPNHVVTLRHNRKVPRTGVEECARRCIFEVQFKCRGFDYQPDIRDCWLTEETPQSAGGVQIRRGADFYERIQDGPLSEFVCYGFGSLPALEGYQIYNRIMLGVTLDACAQLCLAERTFDCSSFDYSFGDKACHMSQYIAANVQGINTQPLSQYKVMHYEKKEEFLEYFYPTPYAVVLGNNEKTYTRVTPDRCARNCLEEREFVCRSFDYRIQEGTCLLSSKTGSDVGGLYYQGLAQVHHFEMKPLLDCGGILKSEAGNFASPNWPRNYAHHLNCSWHIRVPRYKVVHFTFIHFDLGRHTRNPCDDVNDKLVIMEVTSHGLVRFCASPTIASYVSQANDVTMQLLTNGQNDAQGFRVQYKADWPCHAVLTEDNGEFASPGWPEQYPLRSKCIWTIHGPFNARVFVHFTNIDLENHGLGRCNERYDSIEIFDGDSPAAISLGKLCGTEQPQSFSSTFNILLVKFKSDDRVQKTGFHATYKFIYKTTTTPTTTTTRSSDLGLKDGGLGSNNTVQKALTALFFEPGVEPSEESEEILSSKPNNVDSTTPQRVEIGKDGGGLAGDDKKDITSHDVTYVRTMWALIVSLLILLLVVILVLIFVCRHYRRRIPKRRNVPNYTFTEENLSLYEKDNMTNTNCEDVECHHTRSEPTPDIAFSNPMYDQRFPKETDTEETGDC